MAAFIPKRRSSGEWITRIAAEHADIRTLGDALAFLFCAVVVVALGWMVTHPREFYAAVMGVFGV